MANCSNESRDNRNPQSNSRERSVAPPSTRAKGRGRSGPSQHRRRGGTVSKTERPEKIPIFEKMAKS